MAGGVEMRAPKLVTVTLNPAIDLACGVPDFKAGQVNRVDYSRTDAGGKGVNIARLLRLFKLPVIASGFLGEDNPTIFEKLFREEQITDAFIRVPGETRIGIKILDEQSHVTTDINFPGLAPKLQHFNQLLDTLTQLAGEASIVIIAGSVPAGLPENVVGLLVSRIKAQGAKVFVDTSGPAFRQAVESKPDLIKPNLDELSEYVGRPLSQIDEIVAEARKLLDLGIETVVVSLGSRGALFVEKTEAVLTQPPEIVAVSTVGAGDAMVGSLAVGSTRQLPLVERARLATAVSAAVVTQAGPGLSSLAVVENLEALVQLKSINE